MESECCNGRLIICPLVVLYSVCEMLSHTFFFCIYNVYLFIYFGCTRSSFLCGGFPLAVRERGPLPCSVWASCCSGFSCGARAVGCGLHQLKLPGQHTGSVVGCGAWAQFLHRMWDPPRPGIEPVFPALAGMGSVPLSHQGSPPYILQFVTQISSRGLLPLCLKESSESLNNLLEVTQRGRGRIGTVLGLQTGRTGSHFLCH